MERFCKIWILLFLIHIGFRGWTQNFPDIEGLLESNSIEDTEDGYQEMVNTLMYLAHHKLNLNRVGFDSLKMLFLLSDSQIDQLLLFRRKHGDFAHLNELLWVPGIGPKDFDNILPFVTLGQGGEQVPGWGGRKRLRQELLAKVRMSLPRQEGYRLYAPGEFEKRADYERKADNRFHGPPFGSTVKYKMLCNDYLQAGITLENDAGEGYFTRNQKTGFDFVSGHVRIMGKRFLQQVVVGDYRVQWGQGLVAWSGFSSGKSNVVIGNEKSGKGFAAYTSTDENNYLRGLAVSVKPVRGVTMDLFFSRKKTDGNITPADTLAEEDLLSVSLYQSGYHRNNNECAKKHTLKELTTGLSLHWNAAFFKLGVNALYYDFTPALIPGGRQYQQYNDTGEKRWLASMDYKTALGGVYLFGEVAVSDNGTLATVNGLRKSTSFLSACLLYRRYDKQYVSHYAAGFGEYSNTSNEEGVYCGLDFTLLRNLKINVYGDWFRFFSPRYLSSIPGDGWEILGEAQYNHHKFGHALRCKYEVRPEDLKGVGSIQREKCEYRYQFNYHHSDCFELRTRVSVSGYGKGQVREQGYLLAQDVICATRKANFKMQYRVAWFDTDSYQSRIYAYENNVLYGYSFPAFMGEGWRSYLNLSWKPARGLTFYFKAGLIVYSDRDSISSGLTKVEGNKQVDLAFQVRFTL